MTFTFVITPEDRASFRRCGRQWDFGSLMRRNLTPARAAAGPEAGQAIRDALDIYYFPGMWDWDQSVTLPLVLQGFERALARQRERSGADEDAEAWPRQLEAGRRLLDRYAEWAPAVDRFSPVMVAPDYEVTVLDPDRPGASLVTPAGAQVRYRGRIDMLAVDASDAYWIVRHRAVAGDWLSTGELLDDEEAAVACWAWENFYPGLTVAGTIYNEFRLLPEGPARRKPRLLLRLRQRLSRLAGKRVRQHEPSGGGRAIPQHRRLYAAAREPEHAEKVVQQTGGGFRRTLVRRSPEELAAAWRRLAADASEMIAPDLTIEPAPSDANCPPCPFRAPCRAMFAGQDAEAIVRSAYRERPPVTVEEGRLGGGTWGTGRGAAPPRFRDPGNPQRGAGSPGP